MHLTRRNLAPLWALLLGCSGGGGSEGSQPSAAGQGGSPGVVSSAGASGAPGGTGGSGATSGSGAAPVGGSGPVGGAAGSGATGGVGGVAGAAGAGPPPPVTVDDDPIAPLHLIPVPRSVAVGVGHVHLSGTTRIVASSAAATTAELLAEVLRASTGHPLPVVFAAERRGDIVLEIDPDLDALGEEGYLLEVEADRARLRAAAPAGLFYSTQTLRQLLPPDIESATVVPDRVWRLPRVRIDDAPRFEWRGLALDVARHFFGTREVERLVDLIAMHKLNRLHLHLTDDQGWRIEILSWPNLAAHGGSTEVGGGPGGYFTQQQYRDLVAYAAERFVTVVPEIDMPGHTNAALASYASLNESGVAEPLYTGTAVGFSSLWLGAATTEQFVADVLQEVAALTAGPYLHVGGDEADATDPAEYVAFIEWVDALVQQHGKSLVGWHDVARASLTPGGIAQHWHADGLALTQQAARSGLRILMSPAEHAYLDMQYSPATPVGQHWAGYVDVQTAYEWSPVPAGLEESDVIGVESALWTETVETREHIDTLVFPRLCGHAEIGWSPAPGRSWEEYRVRLGVHGARLGRLGVAYFQSPLVSWTP